MEILPSARKHGIRDEAIRHAWKFAIRSHTFEYDGEERLLVIGPDEAGALLELVACPGLAPDRIVHADRLRPKYYELL